MKISADKNSPYYTDFLYLIKEVRINGELLLNVIFADTDNGIVWTHDLPITPSGDFTVTKRKGKVTIKLGDALEFIGGRIVLARE